MKKSETFGYTIMSKKCGLTSNNQEQSVDATYAIWIIISTLYMILNLVKLKLKVPKIIISKLKLKARPIPTMPSWVYFLSLQMHRDNKNLCFLHLK